MTGQLIVGLLFLFVSIFAVGILYRAFRTGNMLFFVVDANKKKQPVLFGCFVAMAIPLVLYSLVIVAVSLAMTLGIMS